MHNLPRCLRVFSSILILAITLLMAQGRAAAVGLDGLKKKMGDYSVGLKEFLKLQGYDGIAGLSTFQVPPQLASNPGAGVADLLAKQMKIANVPVELVAKVGIAGTLMYYPKDAALKDINKVEIELSLYEGNNNKGIYDKIIVTVDHDTIAALIGLSEGDPEPGGPIVAGDYGIEILVNGKAPPVRKIKGVPFVKLGNDDIYTIRLINRSDFEAAAWVGIDGLSMFAFNQDPEPDGQWRDYRVVVPAKTEKDGKDKEGSLEIKGWYFHAGDNGSKKFLVTDYPESAAKLKGISTGLGMITVQFWACWEKGARVVPRERATGFGPTYTETYRSVQRVFSPLKETITIRYSK